MRLTALVLLPLSVTASASWLLMPSPPAFAQAADSDGRAALLTGVREIAAPGLPGALVIVGRDAFPLVLGKSGRSYREPVAAAGRMGKGRVVGWGHDGYFAADALRQADTGRLMINTLHWAAGGKSVLCVGVIGGAHDVADYLRGQDGVIVTSLDSAGWTAAQLGGLDVVLGVGSGLTDLQQAAVAAFVKKGGGFVGAETGWGWQQVHPDRALEENGGNRILRESGIRWSSGTLERTGSVGFTVPAKDAPDTMLNAAAALDALAKGGLTAEDAGQAVWTITRAVEALPGSDTLLLPRLHKLLADHEPDFSDLKTHPVTMASPLDRLALTLETRAAASLPPDKVTAHPSAASFPGLVSADAPRVTRSIEIDTTVPEWHSTGLYAAPGDKITVTLPAEAAKKGLRVRIGAHRDTLWHLPVWQRAPEITRSFPLNTTTTLAANAFGGAVFIEVPEVCKLGSVKVTVGGAVEAPYFVKNQTSLAAWKTTIRNAPGPWAELQGDKCILTVPSAVVRDLDDPQALMAYWDDVMDNAADLYARPRPRTRQERYCTDRQISAGYMHSGYPIMTWEDVEKTFVNLSLLRGVKSGKTWGFYHELGHNHQVSDWTFAGTGEVTNNLFSLYGSEVLNGVTPDNYAPAHPAMDPAKQTERLVKYLADGAKFEDWQNSPFLALTMYAQLREAFGWESYKKVFAEYRALPQADRPRTELEKHDQWMVRFSMAVGKNLGPFFTAWGVPTSEAARSAIASLPPWMPADFPPAAKSVTVK